MIQAHDIVLFNQKVLISGSLPEWLTPTEVVYGTVRRALSSRPDVLPIGLRGRERNQRLALEIPKAAIQKVVHPWEIIDREARRQSEIAQYPVYQQFHQARNRLIDCRWGIGGSLGLELTSGIAAVKVTSDLDLLLYADTPAQLPLAVIQAQRAWFETLDTQVITPKGGFSLKEYLRDPQKKILVKTVEGPKLTNELW